MMAFLPQSTILGKLEMIEIYEFYDHPVLFACKNASGSIFLAAFVDENDNFDTWLYAGMSQRRFECVRSGDIDLQASFAQTEDGVAFAVRMPCNGDEGQPSVEPILSGAINPDWLPSPGEYLTTTMEHLLESEKDLFRQGRKHFRSGDLEQAIHDFTQVIEQTPSFTSAYYVGRAAAYYRLGRVEQATQDFAKAVDLTAA